MRSAWLVWSIVLCGGCVVGSGESGGAARHLGPVTATVQFGERTLSCSQVGVCEGEGATLRVLVDPGWRPIALAVRPAAVLRRALVLVGGGIPARSGHVLLLDDSGREVRERRLADDLVYAVALASSNPLAAAACADGRVLLLAVPALASVGAPWRHGGPAVAVAFSPDGSWLASGGSDGKILLGATTGGDGETIGEVHAVLDHTGPVTCLAWSRDSRLISGASDGKVRLHDRSGRLLHTWQRLGGSVVAVRCRSDDVECQVARGPGEPPVTTVLSLP